MLAVAEILQYPGRVLPGRLVECLS